MTHFLQVGILGVASTLIASAVHGGAPRQQYASILARSIVSQGDSARIDRVLMKAQRGERVTVAVIGGSITQGAMASAPAKRYGDMVAAWWRGRFPNATIEFVNAGIGATGSNYGALRARRDLLSHHPDFVVVEYAVNDPNSRDSAESLEGLIRQILDQPEQPAVVLLFMMSQGGSNAQEWHAKVGERYGLPMLSYRDALWPEMRAGRMKWEDVEADVVHPNDAGHAWAARMIVNLLEKDLQSLAPSGARKVPPIPSPLVSDEFEHVALHEATELRPVSDEGWTLDAAGKCWRADKPGSRIEFRVTGRRVLALFWRIRGPMGRVRAQVDDAPPVTLEGWFDQTWGGYQPTEEIAHGLPPGTHRVRFELLPDKEPGSTGTEFRIFGLGCAGMP